MASRKFIWTVLPNGVGTTAAGGSVYRCSVFVSMRPTPDGASGVLGDFGTPLEAQIRTHDMHRVAEAGVAAHWLYKSGGELDLAEAQRETHRWLQSLLEIQSESRDSKEFIENIKGDLFPEEIYVFTPKGKIMALPRGATAVDFAYGVHTDIGHHCVAARINYEILPLRTELKNGDHVEILTAPTARPNPSWLSFVATGTSFTGVTVTVIVAYSELAPLASSHRYWIFSVPYQFGFGLY